MPVSIAKLESRLGYSFKQSDLLIQSVTHRSHAAKNYERLEFLGDAVLDLIITEALYARFPEASEGQLSRLRANLVRKQTLAEHARELELGSFIIMGTGEKKSGGANRDSILADVFEGVIGAMFLDGGLEVTKEKLLLWYEPELSVLSLDGTQKDAKTRLQEYLQGEGIGLPVYRVVKTSGMAHEQTFTVDCTCGHLERPVTGQGSSRRVAEQVAAARALIALGLDAEEIS